MSTVWESRSPEDTRECGARLAASLRPEAVVLIRGELGAGKTVLVQGLAEGLGLDPRQVQSPSYTLIREHGDPPRLIHIDLYRTERSEAAAIGLEELLEGPGIKAVEWPERMPFQVRDAVRCEICVTGEGSRSITCRGVSEPWSREDEGESSV